MSIRDDHLDTALELCRRDQLAGLNFWVFIDADRKQTLVAMPATPHPDKQLEVLVLQHIAKRLAAVQAIMTCECWTVVYDLQAGETEAEVVERAMAVPPRLNERRIEAVMLIDLHKGKLPVGVMQPIDRDAEARAIFDASKREALNAGTFDGRWCAVIDEPPPLPPGRIGDELRRMIDQMLKPLPQGWRQS